MGVQTHDRRPRITTTAMFIAGLAVCAWAVSVTSVSAQTKYTNVGRGKCFAGCHDHDGEKEWSEKKDGPPPDNHLNSLKQLDPDPKTNKKNAEATKKYI